MNYKSIIALILMVIPWIIIVYPVLKEDMQKRKKVKEFDKICKNALNLISTFLEMAEQIRKVAEEYKYHRYKIYQEKLTQNTRYE